MSACSACSGPFRSSLPSSLHPSRPQPGASFPRFPQDSEHACLPPVACRTCVSVPTLQTPPKAVPPLPRRSKIPCPPLIDWHAILLCNPCPRPLCLCAILPPCAIPAPPRPMPLCQHVCPPPSPAFVPPPVHATHASKLSVHLPAAHVSVWRRGLPWATAPPRIPFCPLRPSHSPPSTSHPPPNVPPCLFDPQCPRPGCLASLHTHTTHDFCGVSRVPLHAVRYVAHPQSLPCAAEPSGHAAPFFGLRCAFANFISACPASC